MTMSMTTTRPRRPDHQSALFFLINEPEISACARVEFEACLEEGRI
jgi:hypothetical protein